MNDIKIITTEDGSHSLYRPDLNETYHSFHGALQESVHVFINMGLKYYFEKCQKSTARILEVGFGTGLNALLTEEYAANNEVEIYFETLETVPLGSDIYEKLNYAQKMAKQEIFTAMHSAAWNWEEKITDFFSIKKIEGSLIDYQNNDLFDLIYFDAFAPSKQPELWSKSIMGKMHSLLNSGGIITTYCAKGQLKRDLRDVGFEVSTLPGAPGKKEMVRGQKK